MWRRGVIGFGGTGLIFRRTVISFLTRFFEDDYKVCIEGVDRLLRQR